MYACILWDLEGCSARANLWKSLSKNVMQRVSSSKMPSSENPSETLEIKKKLKGILRETRYIENPTVPELAFKPDFMINLDSQLIFIEAISASFTENIDWKTLRLIEHLFEVKLFYGNKSSFNLIILNKNRWKPYCIELLENLFDKVTYEEDLENIQGITTEAKTQHFRLWNLEREFEKTRYLPFRDNDLDKFQYRSIEKNRIEQIIARILTKKYRHLIENYAVRNLKNYYIGRARNLKFYFDFSAGNNIYEIKSFRRFSNLILQNLLIKSRLIRYIKENGSIELAPIDIRRMVLIINGSLSGPQHDKFRYLRMLTNAGWDVYPLGFLIPEQLELFL